MTLNHILVRDFTSEQKRTVTAAASTAGKSTSKFCRDAAVEKAGGKVIEAGPRKRQAPAKKAATKRGRP